MDRREPLDRRELLDRRALLASLGVGLAAVAGCTSTFVRPENSDSEISGDRVSVRNASEDVLSFEMRILDADSGATLYEHTTTFDPGESLGLGEDRAGETLRFLMATPGGGETVFERTVAPNERYELAIRSQTTVEVEDHVEK